MTASLKNNRRSPENDASMKALGFGFFFMAAEYLGLETGMFWIYLNMIEKKEVMKDVEHLRGFSKGGKVPKKSEILFEKLIGEDDRLSLDLFAEDKS